jgi:hypothetical protein
MRCLGGGSRFGGGCMARRRLLGPTADLRVLQHEACRVRRIRWQRPEFTDSGYRGMKDISTVSFARVHGQFPTNSRTTMTRHIEVTVDEHSRVTPASLLHCLRCLTTLDLWIVMHAAASANVPNIRAVHASSDINGISSIDGAISTKATSSRRTCSDLRWEMLQMSRLGKVSVERRLTRAMP